jgi:hypothetical protein
MIYVFDWSRGGVEAGVSEEVGNVPSDAAARMCITWFVSRKEYA